MTLPVFVRCNQKSRGSIRGTICLPGSRAISGMAHSDISFSGDPRIQPSKQSFRGVAKGFQAIRSFENAPASYEQLAIGGVGNVRKAFGEIQNVEC